MNKTRTYYNS